MNNQTSEKRSKNRRTTLLLSALVVLMFGFGFAMVPLYNLFCAATGTQSISQRKAIGPDLLASAQIDESRWVTVKFDTSVHPNLPWEFNAQMGKIRVHPGKTYTVNFNARNRSHERVTGQAIPSIAPWQATPYFSKLECFCFHKQTLRGDQTAEMPLRFVVSPNLPKEINSLTLSYSFMRLKGSNGDEGPGLPTRIANIADRRSQL